MNLKHIVKLIIRKLLKWGMNAFRSTSIGLYVYEHLVRDIMNQTRSINHKSHSFKFSNPNKLTSYRIESFSAKEPQTLEWIDSIPKGAVLWDIGANVGLYSIYAAMSRQCNVFAFEPSVFNLELLARNIYLNTLQNQITIVPIALSDLNGTNTFKMSNTEWSGALSTFGKDYDQDGNQLKEIFEYQVPGIRMSDVAHLFKIPEPDYIKIDVDGIEHLILSGGEKILSNVRGVMIEINDNFVEQSDGCKKSLSEAGLELYKKCDIGLPHMYNQWWIRTVVKKK